MSECENDTEVYQASTVEMRRRCIYTSTPDTASGAQAFNNNKASKELLLKPSSDRHTGRGSHWLKVLAANHSSEVLSARSYASSARLEYASTSG